MIPVSFSWDTREKLVGLKWNGFFSSGWEDGKILTKILGFSIPLPLEKKGDPFSHKVDLFKRGSIFSHKMEI
jgi:hypothetical protein